MEEWQRIPQTRRDLVARLAPVYQTASRARKQLVLDEVVKKTGYRRKSAIRLLNHPPESAPTIHRLLRGLYERLTLVAFGAQASDLPASSLVPVVPLPNWSNLPALLEQFPTGVASSIFAASGTRLQIYRYAVTPQAQREY